MTYDDIRYEQGFKDILSVVPNRKEFIRRIQVDVFGE